MRNLKFILQLLVGYFSVLWCRYVAHVSSPQCKQYSSAVISCNANAIILLVLMLMAVSPAYGQSPTPDPALPSSSNSAVPHANLPVGPLWIKPPNFCKWTVTETTFDDAPKASVDKVKNQAPTSRVKVITIVKTGDITYQCIKTPDRQSESWRIGPLQYNVTNGAGSFSGTDPAEPNYAPMEPVDLPECAWISRKNFHDFMEIADSRCAVYVDTDVSPETVGKAAGSKPLQGIIPDFVLSKNTRVACIDAKTKFPRMMQVGFVIRSYEFTLLPPKKQSLPQPLAEACEAIMRANRAFYQSPARP